MGYYGKFVHGSKSIDLNSGNYGLDPSFVPPGTLSTGLMAGGLFGRKYRGGRLVDRAYDDKPLSLPLQVSGASVAETHRAVLGVLAFLESALNDRSETTYFVFGPSDAVPYEPKFGQNFMYYEIKSGPDPSLFNEYGIGATRETYLILSLPLTVAPFALGRRQLLGSGTGGILEHHWATSDGKSRGVIIPEATTNRVGNPVFGHRTNYNTDWADGADLIDFENQDLKYVLFGESSAKLVATGGSTNTYTTSVTAANTNTHAFQVHVKLPDGGVVSGSIVTLAYAGSGLTESYRHIGDGWYLVSAAAAGVASAQNFVITAADGYTIYMDGVQIEENDYPTPVCWGDLLDCSWGGTAHESTSSRTAGRLRWDTDKIVDMSQGLIRIAFMIPYSGGTISTGVTLFNAGVTAVDDFYGRLTTADKFKFGFGGTASILSAAQTFSAGDILVLHFVWSPSGAKIYLDGSEIATGSYARPVGIDSNYFFLGTDNTGAGHSDLTFNDLTTWNRPLSATEVSDDFDNISEWVSGGDGLGQTLNPVPWLWTDDGDDTVDNCYDSTRENWAVVGGIPGNVPADTLFDMRLLSLATSEVMYLCLQPFPARDFFADVEYGARADATLLFHDLNDVTAVGDACGGYVLEETIGTTAVKFQAQLREGPMIFQKCQFGRGYYLYFRCVDAGSDLQASLYVEVDSITSGVNYATDWEDIDPHASNYQGFLIGPIHVSDVDLGGLVKMRRTWVTLQLKRKTGSADVRMDYIAALPTPFAIIDDVSSSGEGVIVLKDGQARVLTYLSYDLDGMAKVTQHGEMAFEPNRLNFLMAFQGGPGITNDITWTIIYTNLYVTPRWSLV